MSTIDSTSGSATGDALAWLSRANSAADPGRSSPSRNSVTNPTESGDRPAVVVDLSDSSKALLERTKIAQTVADKLDQRIAALKDNGTHVQVRKAKNDEALTPLDSLSTRSAPRAAETKWEAGAPYGDPTQSDAELIASTGLDVSLLALADHFDEQGFPPETGQALRGAVKNGTLKFHKASEVPDVNFHSTHTFTPSAIGGGYDVFGSTEMKPTGATKEALDQGRALAMWSADRGDIYITW